MVAYRLIIDSPASGARNMAVDEALLLDAAENAVASLRFYGWDEPTLSLGYFQQYADRQQHAASRECAIVRRQTGGGAILHDRELTYSIALPVGHPLSKQPETLYRVVHQIFIDVLSPLSATSASGSKLEMRPQSSEQRTVEEPFLCFQRQSPGDVVWAKPGTPRDDSVANAEDSQRQLWKILGSAQRRYRGAVLQHGSILLGRSQAAPELPGLYDLVALTVETDMLAAAASTRLADALQLELSEGSLPEELESKARELTNSKYGSPAWTKRR